MRNIFLSVTLLFLLTGCSGYQSTTDFVFPSAQGKAEYIAAYDKALVLWNVPFEETDVKTSCGTAHVIMCGPKDGESVVLFHGMDASSTMWFPNVNALSKKNRVYAIDFPLEAGKSVAISNKLTNNQINIFYTEVFEHFKMNDINLVAASRGGWMATFLALQPKNKIKKLILLSPAQTIGGMKKPRKVLTAIALKLYPNRKRLDRFFNAFSVYPEKIDPLYKEQFYLANEYASSKPRYLNMLQFSKKELRSLKIPVLILVGDHDIISDNSNLEKAHELIPGVETVLVKDAGHFLSIDQSAEVNAKIIDFLNR